MRHRSLLVAALLAGAFAELGAQSQGAEGVAAQTRAADGVVALARGDDQGAVEILKPIAEDWRKNEQVAEFFMAGLYDAGRGVPIDPLRACALYSRAASQGSTVLGREASRLLKGAIFSHGPEFTEDCQVLANVGLDNGFEPVTFDLGPGHFVEWTLAAATVTYAGKTTRVRTGRTGPGARILPLEHSELATGPAGSDKRHFVRMFLWRPTGDGREWQLFCDLFEIVRDQVIHVETLGPLATTDAAAPPSAGSFNAADYVVLRVDGQGHAERAVLTGPHLTTERIESDAERREIRDQSAARAKALQATDWTQRFDVRRAPALAYVDAEGCGNIRVYGWSANRAEAIVVRGSVSGPGPQSVYFDIGRPSAGLSIDVHVYASPQNRFDFCSDVGTSPDPDLPPPEIWHAVAGAMAIELSPPGLRSRQPTLRWAIVTVSNFVLKNAAGKTLVVPGPVKLAAFVGSFSG